MSCFQARLQDVAWSALARHAPDGIQLTPGNLPVSTFRDLVATSGLAVRFHHGFSWDFYRMPVWTENAAPLFDEIDRSVHPPPKVSDLGTWLVAMREQDVLLETMMPGLPLGCGDDLSLAMDIGVRLAVDVSHLHIQACAGALDANVRARLEDYDRVAEIHVSHNDGRSDQHRPITEHTPGLAWARARRDLPIVLESRWHRASWDEQRRQLDWLRDA